MNDLRWKYAGYFREQQGGLCFWPGSSEEKSEIDGGIEGQVESVGFEGSTRTLAPAPGRVGATAVFKRKATVIWHTL